METEMTQEQLKEEIAKDLLEQAPGDVIWAGACEMVKKINFKAETTHRMHEFSDGQAEVPKQITITIDIPEDVVFQSEDVEENLLEMAVKEVAEQIFGYYDSCASILDSDEAEEGEEVEA